MPGRREPREDSVLEHPGLRRDELVRAAVDGRELLARASSRRGRSPRLDAGVQLLLEAGDADHEELVEVRATIARNLSRSSSGIGRVRRLREDARVELEPRQLAVQVVIGRDSRAARGRS